MRTLRKYTGFLAKIHSFALFFFILSLIATPQLSKAFAQNKDDGIKVLHAPLTPQAIEGEFLVELKDNKSLKTLNEVNKPGWIKKLGKGVKIDTSLSLFNIAHVKVANPASTGQWENLANIMSSDPNVANVTPNYVVHALETPLNDPMAADLWHLDKISAYQAWKTMPASRDDDIIVAVIDTGIQYDHEDLRDHIWRNPKEIPNNGIDDDDNGYPDDAFGWNFQDGNKYTYSHMNALPVFSLDPTTEEYRCAGHPTLKMYEQHATHVAGLIAAVKNNNMGIAGVAERVKIMPLKVLGGTCSGGDTMSILHAIQYAVENGARIINMSLGGYGHSILEQKVLQTMSDKGILFVIAAGNDALNNDGRFPSYPASYPAEGIISVAASTEDDKLARFSNFGKRRVDLAAPGEEILSTVPSGETSIPDDHYKKISGTSMATPIVSGVAALLLAQNPRLTNLQIKKILMETVDKTPALANASVSGGRLNAYKALSQQRTIANRPSNNQVSNKPKNLHRDTNNVGGIRIFDNRTNEQKW